MKSFQVYGIGNALLDIDMEVDEEILNRFNINKGVMTLIDEVTHHRLMHALEGFEHLKACGGSAANTLCTLQQLGAQTFYSCKIGKDEAGDYFYENLCAQGIQTNLNDSMREGVTGKCLVLVTPDADRTMNTFLGATALFSKAQLSEEALMQAEYLYIEGYLVAQDGGRAAAIQARQLAKKHQVKTAITLSDPNMVTYFKQGLCDIIESPVELLFCNEREALLFTDSQDLTEARIKLQTYAKTFVVTLGEKGAYVFDGKNFIQVPPYHSQVIDTVGAGDVFAGVFLYGITHGEDYASAADLANYAAAKVVAKFGPRLTQDEIKEVLSYKAKKIVA